MARRSRDAVSPTVEAPDWDVVLAFPRMCIGVRAPGAQVEEIAYLQPGTPPRAPRTALAERAAVQLGRYRDDPDAPFDLPVAPRGTLFQRRVWGLLSRIPRGAVRTYGMLARELGSAARAVGQACGDNRLPIVIPCHRVVAAHGLGGFAHAQGGFLLEAKAWLLAHERAA